MPMMKNYMEDGVASILGRMLESLDCCECEECKYDIIAITLNSLPPKYVVTKRGELYMKLGLLQQQFEVDIMSAITKAVEIVKKHPRHDERN